MKLSFSIILLCNTLFFVLLFGILLELGQSTIIWVAVAAVLGALCTGLWKVERRLDELQRRKDQEEFNGKKN
jgi:hypothetical protein